MKYFFLIYLVFVSFLISAQIRVDNPSFEDTPSDATVPHGWYPCELYTTPDILPGFWGVYQEANDGQTYVGIITRSNGTWESFGQRLSEPVATGSCYTFNIDLAFSNVYAGFNNPIKLRIYLGDNLCDKDLKIFESPIIKNVEWEKHKIIFTSNKAYKYIILEAYHTYDKFSYKGNILIDNMTSIKICDRV